MPEIYSADGKTQLRWFESIPQCGRDFCDSCGDCLACYGDLDCPGGYHRWVLYEDTDAELIAELERGAP